MTVELLRMEIAGESDVFAVRRCGRQVAALVGFERQDQIRVATALSEIGRELVVAGTAAHVLVSIDEAVVPTLSIAFAAGSAARMEEHRPNNGTGISGARRLVDELTLTSDESGHPVVTLRKRLPAGYRALTPPEVTEIRQRLAELAPTSPLDEMRAQNSELLTTLDQLRRRQEDLLVLNAELQETNLGVVAMYAQLSEELEQTNRGVVALYAELDEKGLQLKQASEAKSRFLANVSHELRTPVNSILGLARLLLDPTSEPISVEQRRQLELVAANAADLLGLVNELLDLSKAESGRLEPVIALVDVAELFEWLRGTLWPVSTSPDVRLLIGDVAGMPVIYTDRDMLVHILRNLLTNGLKFTQHGEVRLTVTYRDSVQRVAFVVSDTGIGIPPEHQSKVFEEFHQVRGPLQVRSKGTGLGLPYARRLAQLLGGDIALASTLGQGSTFTVDLPVTWLPPLDAEVLTPPPNAETSAVRVGLALVVDDDEAFRRLLHGLLEPFADVVVEADGGAAALEVLREQVPDVVFFDVRMPDVDGVAVLTTLASDPTLRHVPVVVVTSVDLHPRISASLAPAVTLLSKAELTRDKVGDVLRHIIRKEDHSDEA